jgi:hypothetical protein
VCLQRRAAGLLVVQMERPQDHVTLADLVGSYDAGGTGVQAGQRVRVGGQVGRDEQVRAGTAGGVAAGRTDRVAHQVHLHGGLAAGADLEHGRERFGIAQHVPRLLRGGQRVVGADASFVQQTW